MGFFSDLRKLDGEAAVAYVAILLATIFPGLLALQLFRPDLVASLETVKLVLLAAALGLPVYAVNVFAATPFAQQFAGTTQDKDQLETVSGIGAVTGAIVYHASLLVAYLGNFSFRWFLLVLLVAHIMVWTMVVIGAKQMQAQDGKAKTEKEKQAGTLELDL